MSEVNLTTVKTVDREPFKYMVSTIGNLPTSFVDSMSYYECIAWLIKFLETEVIPTVNNNGECVIELQGKYIELLENVDERFAELVELYNQLKDFVDNYFDNLDVQEEINNKLDQMAEDGVLQEIISQYLNTTAIWAFDNVADMKSSPNLVAGSFANTLGYHVRGDGGAAKYKIVDKGTIIANEKNYIAIGDDYIAEIVLDDEKINVKQFGAYGDDTNDDTNAIQSSIDYAVANGITEIIIPKGTYKTTSPIMLYDFLTLKGYKREDTIIKKYGHTADPVYNLDCVLTATYRTGSSLTYPRYITIEGICLESGDNTSQPTYGLYFLTAAFITIKQFASRHTGTCIYLGDMWLSTLKEVSTGYGTTGIQTRSGTTLDINNTYTAQNSSYGYYFEGTSYSQFSNLACDSSPNAVAYYFYYCQLNISGIGCEAEDYSNCMYFRNAHVSIQNADIRVNKNNASSVVLKVQASNVSFNNITVGKETDTSTALGKFLEFAGNDSFLSINSATVYPSGFATANTGNNNNNISINNKYGMFNTTPEGLGFIGNAQPDGRASVDYEKLNIKQLRSQLSSPINHIQNTTIDGASVAYEHDNRPIGAIVPNAGLNKDGAVMLVKSSWDKIVTLPNTVSATAIVSDKLVLTFSSLSLGANIDSMAIKINTNWRIRKAGAANWTTLSAVDYDTNTITLNTTSGYTIGDTVELLPPRDVRECSFIPVQGVLTGATAARPGDPKNGLMYYDTTLNKPIWYISGHWKDASGTNV